MATKEDNSDETSDTSSNNATCQTCDDPIESVSSRLECENCHCFVHIACLKNNALPTNLLGDTFFVLVCKNCSTIPRTEVVKRDKVNWLSALVLAMYNLKRLNPDIAREGFYHWKLHVAAFLEKHWLTLFGPQMKKRKTWLGTISGTMSHWSGVIFRSGLVSLKESGWWKLISDETPRDLLDNAPSSISRSSQGVSLLRTSKNACEPAKIDVCFNKGAIEKTIQSWSKNAGSSSLANNQTIGVGTATSQISSPLFPERKRTRGVQSSIATAMALKEKRSTLLEAKDIRKAKQQQIQTEIQEHHHRQHTQSTFKFATIKDENSSLPINAQSPDEEVVSKKIRLDINRRESSPSSNISSRRSSTDSGNQKMVIDDEIKFSKTQGDALSTKQLAKKDMHWYQSAHLPEAQTSHPPLSLFNEEEQNEVKNEIKIENDTESTGGSATWSTIDIILNRDEEGREIKSTIELVGESEVNSTGFSSAVDDDDLVSECMSRDSFPNVEDLVSGLSSNPAAVQGGTHTTGVSKTIRSYNSPIGNRSPISSQACSSIASSEDTYEDQKSPIGSPSSTSGKDEKDLTTVDTLNAPQKKKQRKNETISLEDEKRLHTMLQHSNKSYLNKAHVRSLMRKLEIRKEKRAKGTNNQPLSMQELHKANINLPLNSSLPNKLSNTNMNTKKGHTQKTEQLATNDTKVQAKLSNEDSPSRVLDRFQILMGVDNGASMKGCSFRTRLLGRDYHELQCVKSPHTGRMLKPFIRRDFETEPLKLRLLREILTSTKDRREDDTEILGRHPIDYMYVRAHHIPSVNQLVRQFFWPGIDLSECLQYPDFSCVAVYRKIVVGFAFLVPDVSYIEAYISFIFTHPEWRRKGIAKFMLYHLIQTCMGKDITLHVSANNPAILLYQKFGFKVEEYVTNFYDKYLPPGSKECKNALFLRLSR